MSSWYLTAPDLSVTITDDEAIFAFEIFALVNWDELERQIPEGATDTSGVPLDRNNRNIRLGLLAEAVTSTRKAPGGTGIDQMDNPHYESMINGLLDAYDRSTMYPEGI